MPSETKFKNGEQALLLDRKDKTHLITLIKDQKFHTNQGVINHNDIIGSPSGNLIYTSKNHPYFVFKPTLADYILKMSRGAQVIYPKDLAHLVMWTDIFPGCTVLEAGTGSGALTMTLLRAVGPKGKVISYDIRKDFSDIAIKNIQKFLGKTTNLKLVNRNIYEEGIKEKGIDRVILDLPEPWRVVDSIIKSLKPDGIVSIYTPTIIQAEESVTKLRETKSFKFINTSETLHRTWNIKGKSVRPDHRMVAHTAFITTARLVKT